MTRSLFLVLILALVAVPAAAQGNAEAGAGAQAGLRVLFVGHDPAAPGVPFRDMATARTYALYRERTAAFEALLRYHFEDVHVVHGEDYEVGMSDTVDVTIFDARPKRMTPEVRKRDPKTGEWDYRPATYLPESFDRPALMIAENSPRIGEPLGLKLDWM